MRKLYAEHPVFAKAPSYPTAPVQEAVNEELAEREVPQDENAKMVKPDVNAVEVVG